MSSSTPPPSSTDLALQPQKNESVSTQSDVKPSEELQNQSQAPGISIELVKRMYEILKGPGTIEQKTDEFLDILAKLEKHGCEVGEVKKLLQTAKESPADFANLPTEFVETFEKLQSIGIRMMETAKNREIKDETLLSDLAESKDRLSQLKKHDLMPALGAFIEGLEKNFNDFIAMVLSKEEIRTSAEEIRDEGDVRADIEVLFICLYFCIVVCGVAFIVRL